MYNFFIENGALIDGGYKICGKDYNHIKNVLRMKTGEDILVTLNGKSDLCCIVDFTDSEVTFEELKMHPLMMLNRQSTTSAFLHNLFIQHQLELVPDIELNSNDLLIDLARIGLGVAFVPDYCLEEDDNDLVVIQTKEKLPMRQMVASVNTAFPISASTEEFLKLLPEM